jgi:hypothetical protein
MKSAVFNIETEEDIRMMSSKSHLSVLAKETEDRM